MSKETSDVIQNNATQRRSRRLLESSTSLQLRKKRVTKGYGDGGHGSELQTDTAILNSIDTVISQSGPWVRCTWCIFPAFPDGSCYTIQSSGVYHTCTKALKTTSSLRMWVAPEKLCDAVQSLVTEGGDADCMLGIEGIG